MLATLQLEPKPDAPIARLVGEVDASNAPGFTTELKQAVPNTAIGLVLDLSETTYIDSSGIGELVSGFTTIANQGGAVKLLNLTKRVQDLLQITKLYTVFEVFDDEAKAVQSFK